MPLVLKRMRAISYPLDDERIGSQTRDEHSAVEWDIRPRRLRERQRGHDNREESAEDSSGVVIRERSGLTREGSGRKCIRVNRGLDALAALDADVRTR
jgi:hypothetical protein